MARDFLKALKQGPVLFDGATGTMLQNLGLKPGGCPDELNLTNPELVNKVHKAYREVGSDVVTTNTFGANRIKLKEYDLEGKLKEINLAAAKNAREAVGDGFVAGCIGPTGRFIEPVGDIDFDTMVDVFTEQAEALKQGGADLFIIETMMDIKEMKAAIIACKSQGLPVVATMTFDESLRAVLGTSPEVFAIVGESIGADCIGANCSLGIEGIYKAVSAMRSFTTLPIIAQPNAGLPVLKGKETVFPASSEEMASFVPRLIETGVSVLGGCCGTTSDHIKLMGDVFKKQKPVKVKEELGFTALAGRTSFTIFGDVLSPVVIGERINPTGRKVLAQEIKEGKTTLIRTEARRQAENGAHMLDVNVGVPHTDEPKSMKRAIFSVNENCELPIVIDSSDTASLEAGLKAVDGKALINSVSGEEKKLSTVLPLAKKYGGAVLGLTLDDSGIPATAEGRFKVAEKILKRALKLGIRKEDLVIDCLAMTVSADQKSAQETLKAIRLVKEKLGLTTILGVSNISFGLPDRMVINSTFLAMALEAGLDSAILNPNNRAIMDSYHSSLVLLNKDVRAERYIKRFQEIGPAAPTGKAPGAKKAEPVAKKEEVPLDIGGRLKKAIVEGDEDGIAALVEEALKEGWDPMKISNDGLVPGLDEVGRLFACNRYYLPQVMLSAETMRRGFNRLKKEFKGRTGPTLGKVLLATVEGDIHDIGKNIVSTLLENHGFEVIDLGKNVPAEKIIDEAVKNKVDVVGLSALMTTTVMEMDNVIKKLKERGIRAVTIVGGAVVTHEFADKIGADEYGGEATEAVEKIKKLVKGP